MRELVRKCPVATAVIGLLIGYFGIKLIPEPNDAVSIAKRAALAAILLYIMYLAGGKEVFRWERGSFFKSVWLYKSQLLITVSIVVFSYIVMIAQKKPFVDGWQRNLAVYGIDAFFVGLFEESWCRGVILCGLLARMGRTRKGMLTALLISSFIFGFVHVADSLFEPMTPAIAVQMLAKTFDTGSMGFLIGAVYLATRNIWAAALLHGLGDYLSFSLQALYTGRHAESYVSGTAGFGDIATVVVFALISLIPFFAALRLIKKLPVPQPGIWKTE